MRLMPFQTLGVCHGTLVPAFICLGIICVHMCSHIPRKHFILTAVVVIFVNFSDGFEFWLFLEGLRGKMDVPPRTLA